MRTKIIMLFLLAASSATMAQRKVNESIVFLDSVTRLPLQSVTIVASPGNGMYSSSENGSLSISPVLKQAKSLEISAIGYAKRIIIPAVDGIEGVILLSPEHTQLREVKIHARSGNPNQSISLTDIALRGVSNSQEILRMVPGLFIAQHQGGGKAEQIFLRGYDNDHGKDIALSMDGMPINMVSHAHGQGYADSHFIIPEVIENINYKKGIFDAEKGDLAVSGWVDYRTRNGVTNTIKVEGGQFNTFRGLVMLNILGDEMRHKGDHLYVAAEYRYSDSYFDNPQHFKRFNFFTKYSSKISSKSWLSLSASAFSSRWNASGQIPEEAVASGKVGYFGAIDPNEGGKTSRYNFNGLIRTDFGDGSFFSNQIYYSKYYFDLASNFTLFLIDELNGDEIRQRESRDLLGYNGAFRFQTRIGNLKLTSEFGLNARFDFTGNSELSHTLQRYTILNRIKLGDISQYNLGPYFIQKFFLNDKLRLDLGARYDRIFYRYENKLASDAVFSGTGKYQAVNGTFSPKVNLNYSLSEQVQTFLSLGKGFNSNDARSVVSSTQASAVLPSAYGVDLGTVLKPLPDMIISATLWYSLLEQEFVYGGDGGTVEFSGKSRRLGGDLSVRYQPLKMLYFDFDLNYANGRAVGVLEGENYIPLAPRWSSTGGLTYQSKAGIGGGLRYRYLAGRPANEDYSLVAQGYFINDLVLNYTVKKLAFGLSVNNLFNVKWKESQFVEETRLRGEQPTEGITFTPGTKFSATAQVSYSF